RSGSARPSGPTPSGRPTPDGSARRRVPAHRELRPLGVGEGGELHRTRLVRRREHLRTEPLPPLGGREDVGAGERPAPPRRARRRRLPAQPVGAYRLTVISAPWGSVRSASCTGPASYAGVRTFAPSRSARSTVAKASATANVTRQLGGSSDGCNPPTASEKPGGTDGSAWRRLRSGSLRANRSR